MLPKFSKPKNLAFGRELVAERARRHLLARRVGEDAGPRAGASKGFHEIEESHDAWGGPSVRRQDGFILTGTRFVEQEAFVSDLHRVYALRGDAEGKKASRASSY